jgi:hypothetical protein
MTPFIHCTNDNATDYRVLSVVTMGLYYCYRVREKRFERSALILTNKRLIVLDIRQRAGMVPDHMSEFFIGLRSYFPGDITGGYLNSENRKHLTIGIDCCGGHLCIDFPMCGWKVHSIWSPNFILSQLNPNVIPMKALPFAKSIMMTKSRVDSLVSINHKEICEPPVLDKTDIKGLPLLEGEVPIDIIKVTQIQPESVTT